MSSLGKELIDKLSNEEDVEILKEVMDFYEYIKQRKHKRLLRNTEETVNV